MAGIVSQITFADYGEIEILGDLERFSLALSGMTCLRITVYVD